MARAAKTAAPKQSKEVLGTLDRERLTEQIEEEQAYRASLGRDLPDDGRLGATDGAGAKSVDTGKLDRRIGHLKRKLAEGTPEELTSGQRSQYEREVKELEEWLKPRLLTQRQMSLMPSDRYEYGVAVRKSSNQKDGEVGSRVFGEKASRYKTLQKMLRPDDPEAPSIEKLRPAR
jgi:hypothetical protein